MVCTFYTCFIKTKQNIYYLAFFIFKNSTHLLCFNFVPLKTIFNNNFMKKNLLTALSISVVLLLTSSVLTSNPSGAPSGRTNSPSDGATCNGGGCHGGVLSTSTSILTNNIPADGYTGGNSYTFTVTIPGSNRKGFEVSPQKADGTVLGTLTAGASNRVLSSTYVTQTSAKNSNPGVWSFSWKAPVAGTGDVDFYGSFVNGQFGQTITQKLTVKEAAINGIAANNLTPISVFPNPSSDRVNINLSENLTDRLSVKLFNLSGEEVLNIYNGAYQSSLSFSSEQLANGVYLLSIVSGNLNTTQKLIINK